MKAASAMPERSPSSVTDEALAARQIAGDHTAIDQLVERCRRILLMLLIEKAPYGRSHSLHAPLKIFEQVAPRLHCAALLLCSGQSSGQLLAQGVDAGGLGLLLLQGGCFLADERIEAAYAHFELGFLLESRLELGRDTRIAFEEPSLLTEQ